MYRSYHGNTDDGDLAHRRPAPLGERAGRRLGRALLRALRVPLGVPRVDARGGGRSARSSTSSRSSCSRAPRRSPRSSSRRSSARTACSCRRPATSQGVRELCDRYGIVYIADEVMVGFGRVGEWFAVPGVRRRARPHHLREGRELGLRAARRRRHLRPHRGALRHRRRSRAGSRTRATRSRARRASRRSRSSSATASSSACATSARASSSRACATMAARHPSVGDVRGLGPVLGDRARARTARRASRSCRSTRAGRMPRPSPPSPQRASAQGVWPFTHFNRVHVAPPLVIAEDELVRGLDVIDRALSRRRRLRRGLSRRRLPRLARALRPNPTRGSRRSEGRATPCMPRASDARE